jgi:hypothetical protein
VSAGGETEGEIALVGKLGELQEKPIEDWGETAPSFDGGGCDCHSTSGRVSVMFDFVTSKSCDTVNACARG